MRKGEERREDENRSTEMKKKGKGIGNSAERMRKRERKWWGRGEERIRRWRREDEALEERGREQGRRGIRRVRSLP